MSRTKLENLPYGFIKGVDLSTLCEIEALGGKFSDSGKQTDIFDILKGYGVNTLRLRIWNNPYDENKMPYGGGTADYNNYVQLARRAKKVGMQVMANLHYSDFWTDPSKQFKPKAWETLEGDALEKAVYDYTKNFCLNSVRDGVKPELVQVGNEITNGMLWDSGKLLPDGDKKPRKNYDALAKLLKAGIKAVCDTLPEAVVLTHLENSCNNKIWREWLDNMLSRGVELDMLGASYYPYWHGAFSDFEKNMGEIAKDYEIPLIVSETSYAFTGKSRFDGVTGKENYAGLVVGDDCTGIEKPYPFTPEGQKAFLTRLIDVVESNSMKGFIYWEPAWLPLEGATWATFAGQDYINEHKGLGNEWANQALFDYDGNALPALNCFRD